MPCGIKADNMHTEIITGTLTYNMHTGMKSAHEITTCTLTSQQEHWLEEVACWCHFAHWNYNKHTENTTCTLPSQHAQTQRKYKKHAEITAGTQKTQHARSVTIHTSTLTREIILEWTNPLTCIKNGSSKATWTNIDQCLVNLGSYTRMLTHMRIQVNKGAHTANKIM